ncbi:MAG TPA: hypothetical protein VFZ21_13925, partial [Gemmatimonadaceae bacterium]|nr:hypothetical protein [Gemmatimonadaceae bacterium]
MPAHAALLRYPHGRVLLARTKLAYVHLRNLLSDAKRDRTAKVAGYVGIWLPDELVLLFLREGEPVNALSLTPRGAEQISIAAATARVPAEPEFGEICFHEAPADQLVCMYHTLRTEPASWPDEMAATDPRELFPHLRSTVFTGVVEVISRDTANYLVFRDGLIEQMYLTDDLGTGRTEQLARLFGPPSPRPRVRVRGFPAPITMPSQAPPGLVVAYRELIDRIYAELGAAGVPVPSAVGERVRSALVDRHTALRAFASGQGK